MKKIIYISTLAIIFSLSLNAQYQNIRVSNISSTSPNEVAIAINPTNPLHLVGGANLNFFYNSTNGGLNWTQSTLTSTLGVWGDPCLVFDGFGNLYYSHLSNPTSGSWLDRIVVQKSTNGGVSWSDGVGVGLNGIKDQDKEWMAVDMTNSQYRNNIYMSWTEFDVYGSTNTADSTRILFSRSTDNGTNWSTTVRISDKGGNCIDSDETVEGAVPAVGPNGEVYTSWSGPLGIMLDKSTNGGVTWGTDIFVTSQPGGWDFAVPGIYRCNGMPVTACDISNSPYRGTVYIMWSDQRNGTNNTDVFLIKSTDGGNSWGQTVRVNTDKGIAHQFFPWMTIDQSNGYLYFIFYDRRDLSGSSTDVYVGRSTNGGETFTNFRISASSFTPSSSKFFGDYTNIAASNGKIYPIWMRMDGTTMSVWMTTVTDSTTTGILDQTGFPSEYFLSQNYPNPFNPYTNIEFRIVRSGYATLKVYDILGKEITTLIDQYIEPGKYDVLLDAKSMQSGVYYYTLKTSDFVETKKLVLVK